MSAGDVAEEVQEWSDSAAEHAEAAARKQIEETGKRFVPYAGRTGPLPDFRIERLRGNEPTQLSRAGESWLLYETARTAITRHAYSPTETFQHAIHAFDYSLGPESAALLAGTRADAFILLTAVDQVPDAGRSTLIGVGAAAALTTGSYAGPGATPARLTAALVHAKTGDILWINGVQMPLSDLRDPAANAALVDLLFEGMNR